MADITFECPSCRKDFVANEVIVGREANCPHCQTKLFFNRGVAIVAREHHPMKKCKFCAELIQAEAKVCRYCGSSLEKEKTFTCYKCNQLVTFPIADYEYAMRSYTQFRCPHCAAPVEIPSSPTKATAPEPKSFNQLAMVISIGAVAIAVVCAVLLYRSHGSTGPSVSNETAVNRPEADAASVSSITAPAATILTGPEKVEHKVEQVQVNVTFIKGTIHTLFSGYDLPLKNAPIYLIPYTTEFQSSYNELANVAVPLLNKRAQYEESSEAWIVSTKTLIEVEKQRAVLFRNKTARTAYADNNGMFAFYDLLPGQYLVFAEGTIKDTIKIWGLPETSTSVISCCLF